MYSDDSLIRTRLFLLEISGLTSFSGLLNLPSPDVSKPLRKRT